ncbi:DUF4349 domain-containing protein [Streptomyces pyxinicus]|uniref:DUF4349 domain-containing protein n=1 Tax=Streptomyces pyxinicus TaxID=2970331 RepID=UPI0028682E7B|nr:DUF4349 domain-containing protein [Streptomyces sp. LP11]
MIERTVEAQDVTDQMVNVGSRVTSQRAGVDRIRALMDRATKLGDVVALEGQLSERQADLEALPARQASLKDRSLATITLSLSEKPVSGAAGDERAGHRGRARRGPAVPGPRRRAEPGPAMTALGPLPAARPVPADSGQPDQD